VWRSARRGGIEYVYDHMIAQPRIVERGARGDGQHRLRVVRM
jgi:hypothetical protein